MEKGGKRRVNILFIGDIDGKPGRRAVARWLPEVLKTGSIDFVVANGENAAGGSGATAKTLVEIRQAGVNAFTMGNHVWKQKEFLAEIESLSDVVRPANYPPGVPGVGWRTFEAPGGGTIGVVNLLGRVFMEPLDCPFRTADLALEALAGRAGVLLVDIHAEATAEKVALGWHLDGRAAAVLGTHTHVQTADERLLPQGTAFISDVGMCGARDGIIGVAREPVLRRFLTALPERFEPEKGPLQFNAVRVEVDAAAGRARSIERLHFEG